MSPIEALFQERARPDVSHPDIWEHMVTIRRFAEKVTSVVEIGCRSGNSATALLCGLTNRGGFMHSYDIRDREFTPPEIPNVTWEYHKQDTHLPEFVIPACELLFIDGCHKYESVKADLRQARLATRFIILHDTSPERDRIFGDGVCRAMRDFLTLNPQWEIAERYPNCNGLTVLEKIK